MPFQYNTPIHARIRVEGLTIFIPLVLMLAVGFIPQSNVSARGSYLHGLLSSDGWRNQYLASMGIRHHDMNYRAEVERAIDALADHIEKFIDPTIWEIPL